MYPSLMLLSQVQLALSRTFVGIGQRGTQSGAGERVHLALKVGAQLHICLYNYVLLLLTRLHMLCQNRLLVIQALMKATMQTVSLPQRQLQRPRYEIWRAA